MTAGAVIDRLDALRPNHYDQEQKLSWLKQLEGQIYLQLLRTDERQQLPDPSLADFTPEQELIAQEPFGEELYLSYLMSRVDLHNGEISKYDQSAALLAAAWRQYADWYNTSRSPQPGCSWKI